MKYILTLLFLLILSARTLFAQPFPCDSICVRNISMDSSLDGDSWFNITIYNGSSKFMSYPWVGAIIYKGDTIGKGPGLNFYGHGPRSSQTYTALAKTKTIPPGFHATIMLVYSGRLWDTCFLPYPCCIDFHIGADITSGCSPLKVQFHSDVKGKDSSIKYGMTQLCYWNFGDRTTSLEKNPVHVFKSSTDTVFRTRYVVHNSTCTDSDFIDIKVAGDMPPAPKLYEATVIEDTFVRVEWQPVNRAVEYYVYRSKDDLNYVQVGKTNDTHWEDFYAQVHTCSWFYRVEAKDSCGNTSAGSEPARNILLKGFVNIQDDAELQWTPYTSWQEGVDHYQLKRNTDGGAFEGLISVVQTEYRDQDFTELKASERCYEMMAFEKNGNGRSSLSNSICFSLKPRLYIPTAFSPNHDGVNDIFYVEGTGISSIEWEIYNRWGERIFKSVSLNEGWDGKDLPEGVYLCKVVASGEKEKFYADKLVHLVR